jgi:hypothetical protein
MVLNLASVHIKDVEYEDCVQTESDKYVSIGRQKVTNK